MLPGCSSSAPYKHLSQHQKMQGKNTKSNSTSFNTSTFMLNPLGPGTIFQKSPRNLPEITTNPLGKFTQHQFSHCFPDENSQKSPPSRRGWLQLVSGLSAWPACDLCHKNMVFGMFLECFGYNFEKTSFGYRIFLDLLISGCPTTSPWLLCFMPIFGKSYRP